MKFSTMKILLAFVVLTCVSFAGCGGSVDGRYPVTGTVIFGDKPMEHGQISFQPASESGQSSAAGIVKDGKFTIEAKKGLLPGEYTVVVTSREKSGNKISGEDSSGKSFEADEFVTYVPEDWGVYSTHKETIKAGKNNFKFEIPRSPEPVAPPKTSDNQTSGGV